MRGAFLLSIIATGCAAGGTDEQAVIACEIYIKSVLKAPSTYQRRNAQSFPDQQRLTVFVEYEAANTFGTPIAATEECEFRMVGGAVPSSDDLNWAADRAVLARRARASGAYGPKTTNLTGDTEGSCCLAP